MEELRKDLQEVRESQIRMEADIKYHIMRTDLLEELHKDNEKRIAQLELPNSAKSYMVDFAVSISKIAGAALAVFALLKYFK